MSMWVGQLQLSTCTLRKHKSLNCKIKARNFSGINLYGKCVWDFFNLWFFAGSLFDWNWNQKGVCVLFIGGNSWHTVRSSLFVQMVPYILYALHKNYNLTYVVRDKKSSNRSNIIGITRVFWWAAAPACSTSMICRSVVHHFLLTKVGDSSLTVCIICWRDSK